jgi:hypothetical protein
VRRQLFAAGVSLALLVAAGSPALADPGHGKAKGHDKPAKTKPVKDPKAPKPKPKAGRVNGGGTSFGGAGFSVQVKDNRPGKSHLNYTATGAKFRCRDLSYSPVVYIQPGPPGAHVTGKCVVMSGRNRTMVDVDATFFDHGATGDEANMTFTRKDGTTVSDSGVIKDGDVTVRN